jgi:5-methylcytosine-specific restriction endonuclease McrA
MARLKDYVMTQIAHILTRPVLTLNRHWHPVQVTPAANAFALIMKGSAVIIDPETYQEHDILTWADASEAKAQFSDAVIHTPRLRLIVPEVIRLTGYEGQGERSVVFSRRNIFKRDKYTCCYCGAQPGPAELTIDHIIPKSKGGRSEWTNCVLACFKCNAKKADRTLEQTGMVLRKVPKKPKWTALSHIPISQRRMSWDQFISKAYWEVQLDP